MPHMGLLRPQHGAQPVARILRAILHRDGPLHHCAEALAHPPRRVRLDVPETLQRLEHVGARHFAHGQGTEVGEGEARQRGPPLMGVFGTAPAGPLLCQHLRGGLGDGRHGLHAALVGQRLRHRNVF